ncbi:ROK family protein [Echinimonas agarilytica]|uniref:ROK family protein n=1 Tax=Echinimonas agarilytica TaxID=1215918 RepID=A0AA41W532_9GAMM|nr:ROK family protein [Echinimonas agarilytica]MCM2679036.1 ROK family protein [Echinimonas agarilytica]
MTVSTENILGISGNDSQSTLGLVYQLIEQVGPLSRIKIAEYAHLAPASITKITRQLLPLGVIREVDAQASTGGRRAINLSTNPDLHQMVAIRLGRQHLHLGLCNLAGEELASHTVSLSEVPDGEALLTQLTHETSLFLSSHKRKAKDVVAIGITSPGLLNSKTGVIRYLPHIDLTEPLELVKHLESTFGVPCYLGNSIRALALAEHYFGSARDTKDVVVVRVHNGIGAGIIIDGAVLMGQDQNRGEIGHIQVDPLGERCHCGNFGCLETIASNQAIVKRVNHLFDSGYNSALNKNDLTMSHICAAANKGDELAQRVLKEVAEAMGKALAATINLLNPQKIVIGGYITEAWQVVEPVLKATLERQTLNNFLSDLKLEPSKLERRSLLASFALVRRALINGELLHHMIDQRSTKES